MKNLKITIVGFFLVFALLFFTYDVVAQTQAPPPPAHGNQSQTVPGGSAPVGGGLLLLIAMGSAYGLKKIYDSRKKLAE